MRFPTRLLTALSFFGAMVWAGFYVLVVVITVAIATFGTLTQSVWEQAMQVPRWFVLSVGVSLVTRFMPMYIANGQTRRVFGLHAAVTALLLSGFYALLMVVGYLLEWLLYDLAGWTQALDRPHLFTEPTQVPLVLVEYLTEFLAWTGAGILIASAYYRWRAGGLLLSIPLGVGLIALAAEGLGTYYGLPLNNFRFGLNLSPTPAEAIGAGCVAFALALALSWPIIRDVPLRDRLT
ncbi:hypothetical protein [Nonomuraea cavernae]|uniref:Uncharacterized protein n=1 Tax=Nonomuraea cavernae TaxID=2045107 RepID=A0A917YSN5_9ACTN|nr:hypothetical protein [Nonomuraea cavernae]MCA2185241.1 hypothetical protein [Nonomuraea cavernae]GGO65836.1 hypothetical protein GCM10012289_18480 [Nonomuraea cavernae]